MVRTQAKDYEDKRRHILRVAAEVFARDGIARASMNEVARACGISKANIYHYYGSKDDLVFDILDTYLTELRDWIVSVDLSDQTAAQRVKTLCREFLLAYEGMDNEHKIQSEGIPLLPPPKQEILRGYQRELVSVVAETLTACAPNALGDKVRRRDVTMSVFGMLNWFYMWHPKANHDDRIAYAHTVADLTLRGIQED